MGQVQLGGRGGSAGGRGGSGPAGGRGRSGPAGGEGGVSQGGGVGQLGGGVGQQGEGWVSRGRGVSHGGGGVGQVQAGGMPLAFTQEDFLVMKEFPNNYINSRMLQDIAICIIANVIEILNY